MTEIRTSESATSYNTAESLRTPVGGISIDSIKNTISINLTLANTPEKIEERKSAYPEGGLVYLRSPYFASREANAIPIRFGEDGAISQSEAKRVLGLVDECLKNLDFDKDKFLVPSEIKGMEEIKFNEIQMDAIDSVVEANKGKDKKDILAAVREVDGLFKEVRRDNFLSSREIEEINATMKANGISETVIDPSIIEGPVGVPQKRDVRPITPN